MHAISLEKLGYERSDSAFTCSASSSGTATTAPETFISVRGGKEINEAGWKCSLW